MLNEALEVGGLVGAVAWLAVGAVAGLPGTFLLAGVAVGLAVAVAGDLRCRLV